MPKGFKIDPEFASLLPAKPPDEYNRLAIRIELEGAAPGSIVVADIPGEGRFLIDGHNTYGICQTKKLPMPEPRVVKLPNREATIEWIVDNQLSRRNLTDEQRAYFIGKKYLERKKAQGRPSGNLPSGEKMGQTEPISGNTAQEVATETGSSPSTVKRNAEFAEAVDAIGEASPAAKDAILNGTSGLSKQKVINTPLPELLCDRCRRVGPVTGCSRCADLRREAGRPEAPKATPAKPPKPSKNGSLVFDPKAFANDYGRLVQHITQLEKAHFQGYRRELINDLRAKLKAFREAFEAAYKDKTKKLLPEG